MFGGKRQSVASKFDVLHQLSVQQQISLLNFYQFLQKEFSLFDHWTESKKGAEYRILMFVKLLVFGRATKVAPFNVFWFPPLSALDNNKFSISGKREDGKINSQRSSTIPGSLLHIIFQLNSDFRWTIISPADQASINFMKRKTQTQHHFWIWSGTWFDISIILQIKKAKTNKSKGYFHNLQ